MIKNYQKGYIALVSAIIIGGIVLAIVISITNVSLSQKLSVIQENQSTRSYYLANACAHMAIVKLQDSQNYPGNEVIDIEEDSCSIGSISGTGNENRQFITSATIGDHTRKIQVIINQIRPQTDIESWEEYIQ